MIKMMYFCVFMVFMQLSPTTAYTVTRDMQQYLKIEETIVKHLKPFIAQQEKDLDYLRTQFGLFEESHQKIKNAANPMDAFLLSKRLTKDWDDIKKILLRNNGTAIRKKLLSATVVRFPYPTYSDLGAAAGGLLRIQKTYNWSVANIASGRVKNFQVKKEFSATDCFQMGVHAEMSDDPDLCVLWLNEAMNRLANSSDPKTLNLKADILDYTATCYQNLGQPDAAIRSAKELSVLMANDTVALESIKKFIDEAKEKKLTTLKQPTRLEIHFDKLCRGDVKPTPKTQAPLRCKYLTRTPFLKFGPIKFEEVSIEPYIVIYYDLIFDTEIKFLQQFSRGLLERTKVISPNGTLVYTTTRTGQSAWLFDESPKQIQALDKRIEMLTGLVTRTAEPIQIVNYGIGGYYAPHMDYVGKGDTTSFPKIGNRIATLLFYLNDVAEGGTTVFPSLDISIPAQKGSAAFWYNLDSSGDPDERTMHAACPVITGEKWVCNKWLHEIGQEFLRPCEMRHIGDQNYYF